MTGVLRLVVRLNRRLLALDRRTAAGAVLVLGMVAWVAWGCARGRTGGVPIVFDEAAFGAKDVGDYGVYLPDPMSGSDVPPLIGKVRHYRVRESDTLLDVARYFDVGYNEIVAANPGIDPWDPAPETSLVLPTAWILPCCTFKGIVVNVPEMRLYFYRREGGEGAMTGVVTHPVAVGRPGWPTPRGRWRVRAKTVNPRWNIPESIRSERIRERGDARWFIAGGDPDNPLGGYRIALTLPRYAIHGTNVPWGIGREVSHGCLQLYPEDIDRLFPRVEIGTPVEVIYQPVKIGIRDRNVYIEAHADLYGRGTPDREHILAGLSAARPDARIDAGAVEAALGAASGVPVRVGRTRR